MTFAIASLARQAKDFALASRAFIMAGMLVAGVALYDSIYEIGLAEGTRVIVARDLRSVRGDPNDLSLVLLFPLSFAVALVLTARTGSASRFFGLCGTGMMIAAILTTKGHRGLLGIAAVFGVFGARRIRSKAMPFGSARQAAIRAGRHDEGIDLGQPAADTGIQPGRHTIDRTGDIGRVEGDALRMRRDDADSEHHDIAVTRLQPIHELTEIGGR